MILKLKGAWRSLTIWFNGVVAVVVPGLPMLQDAFPQLQPLVPDHLYRYALALVIVANIALRFKTTQDLATK